MFYKYVMSSIKVDGMSSILKQSEESEIKNSV